MTVQHKKTGSKGMFYVEYEDEIAAEMVYTTADDKMIIEHTEVDKALRGRDLGDQLIYEAVEFARSQNLKILPACSFARAVFKMKKEYRDVYAEVEN